MANPTGLTIHNSVVNVTVIEVDTAPELKKKSKLKRAKAKIASDLVTQPVIHDYAMCPNINMKKQKRNSILGDDNVCVSCLRQVAYPDEYL